MRLTGQKRSVYMQMHWDNMGGKTNELDSIKIKYFCMASKNVKSNNQSG